MQTIASLEASNLLMLAALLPAAAATCIMAGSPVGWRPIAVRLLLLAAATLLGLALVTGSLYFAFALF